MAEDVEAEQQQTEDNQVFEGQVSDRNSRLERPPIPNVKLCIRSQDGKEEYYRFQRDKRIGSLLSSYCKEKKLDYSAVVFLYNGQRVKPTETPDELGMDNEDMIDAMLHHSGGGY